MYPALLLRQVPGLRRDIIETFERKKNRAAYLLMECMLWQDLEVILL